MHQSLKFVQSVPNVALIVNSGGRPTLNFATLATCRRKDTIFVVYNLFSECETNPFSFTARSCSLECELEANFVVSRFL